MSQQRYQHKFTTGRQLWLGMAVAIGLALGTPAAEAKECHRETPLPADVRLIAPGPEVPEAVARFAGAWIGAWLDKGQEALCHTLVVEEVFANGYARVIYSHGTSADLGRPSTEFLARHRPDHRRGPPFSSTGPGAPQARLSGWPARRYRAPPRAQTAHGRVRLTRVADLSQVGCGPQAGGLPPAPPATGPRDRLTAAELLARPRRAPAPSTMPTSCPSARPRRPCTPSKEP